MAKPWEGERLHRRPGVAPKCAYASSRAFGTSAKRAVEVNDRLSYRAL